MGSRANRARKGIPPKQSVPSGKSDVPAMGESCLSSLLPVPDLTKLDVVFGNIKHLPPYDSIPERFHRSRDPYVDFVSGWFFGGRTKEHMLKLTAREGVDRGKALAAIQSILGSFEPKHEHKEAGCAFLLHEWFELT